MANQAALLLLLIAAVMTSSMSSNEDCLSEVYGMSKWECVMWISGVEGYTPFASLDSCCQQINMLSANCRCDALSQIMIDLPGYEQQVCAHLQMCGLTACPTCSAAATSSSTS